MERCHPTSGRRSVLAARSERLPSSITFVRPGAAMSDESSSLANDDAPRATPEWSTFFRRFLPFAAIAGPALFFVGALFVAADVGTLPEDLEWISRQEAVIGYFGVALLVTTWVEIGKIVSTNAPKTGIAVTLLGTLGALGALNVFARRSLSIDLVDYGFDPVELYDVWEEASTSTILTLIFTLPGFFLAPLITGGVVVAGKVGPRWAGGALLLFVPFFIMAQAAYVALPLTYALATGLLLVGVSGMVRSAQST